MANEDGKSNKVVVVEDDPAIVELLSDELRYQGFEPLILRRGSTVVKTVKDEKPAVVVLDLALPDRDGTHVLKDLKDDWDAKKTPVIIISAYTGRLDHNGRENAEAVFAKPFDLDQLMASIRAAAAKKED
ncbi:MAG: response regulator transcription factor [Chloroflexi bacterium]|nr:response regulator transcription factor [Chloroflexota bacterium]